MYLIIIFLIDSKKYKSNSGLKMLCYELNLAPAKQSNSGLKILYFGPNLVFAKQSNSYLKVSCF